MKQASVPSVWELKSKAKAYYPHSLNMQSKWLRTSVYLYASGKHAVLTGGWKSGSH